MLAVKRPVQSGAVIGRAAYVRERIDGSLVLLSDGTHARLAVSCLMRPEKGDRVALTELADGESFVHVILERADTGHVHLEVADADQITFSSRRFVLAASESLVMQALRDVDLSSAAGAVNLRGASVTICALESLVQCAREYLANVGAYALQVRGLFRVHGKDAILTAEKDIKLDGERISVG